MGSVILFQPQTDQRPLQVRVHVLFGHDLVSKVSRPGNMAHQCHLLQQDQSCHHQVKADIELRSINLTAQNSRHHIQYEQGHASLFILLIIDA